MMKMEEAIISSNSSKGKKVSIVIPCYNVEKYLSRCMESLLAQTIGMDALELIFVDDASTDGTLSILLQLEKEYPDSVIVIANENNQKTGISRNIAIQYATGKYIGFVDADDWVRPEMYEQLYQKAEEYQCDLVGSHLVQVPEYGMTARGRFASEEEDEIIDIHSEEQRKKLLAAGMSVFGTVNVVTKLYLKSFIIENNLHFGEKYAFEDLYFSELVVFYVRRFCILHAEYYHYLSHESSIMTSMDGKKWLEQRQMMLHWLEECSERELLESYYQEIELMFARDYYISNLHFLFTREEIGQCEVKNIEECRKTMFSLFPQAMRNPYFEQDSFIVSCQRQFISHLNTAFRRGELLKMQQKYCAELLDLAKGNMQEELPELHVMVASDAGYLYPAMVLLVSLFHQHSNQTVKVYFLEMGLSDEEKLRLQKLAGQWKDKSIQCFEIEKNELQGLKDFGRFSVAAFFRIIGMGILPDEVHRVLYLDVDMIINGNLSELFLEKMTQPLSACYDINNYLQGNIEHHKQYIGMSREELYFNSGMLLLDMDYIRENGVRKALLEDIIKNFDRYELVDQDGLNKYYRGKTFYLPWQKYNCPCVPLIASATSDGTREQDLIVYQKIREFQNGGAAFKDVTELLIGRAVIIHFCTSQKPWKDREFYQQGNMREAGRIYMRYERMLEHRMDDLRKG